MYFKAQLVSISLQLANNNVELGQSEEEKEKKQFFLSLAIHLCGVKCQKEPQRDCGFLDIQKVGRRPSNFNGARQDFDSLDQRYKIDIGLFSWVVEILSISLSTT